MVSHRAQPSFVQRAQGCLAGLAIGDALGRPAEGLDPDEIAARWGRIEGFVADRPEGSDDTEYALLTAKVLLHHRRRFAADLVAATWRDEVCGQEGGFRGGGFSEMSAIRNLQRGHSPPRSGQHAHSWSDGLAMRVAPIGIAAAGNPTRAAAWAAEDGVVSHSGEGIYAGQAVAAAVASAMAGSSVTVGFEAALAAVPPESWTARALRTARSIVESGEDWPTIARRAVDRLAVTSYFWADLAPEAVGLAFTAVLAGAGDLRETLLNAVNLGRDADTIAAMAGAIAGASAGIGAAPTEWLDAVAEAPGICLRTTRGMHPLEVAADLCALAEELANDTVDVEQRSPRVPIPTTEARGRRHGHGGASPGTRSVPTFPRSTSRTRAVVNGLVTGDALSWPAWWHRLALLPERRAHRLAEVAAHGRRLGSETLPVPYLHATPASTVDPVGATVATEWFAVAVLHLAGHGLDGTPSPSGVPIWWELAATRATQPSSIRARLGTIIALENLANALTPPASGHDDPHYFDDGACLRAVAAGLLRPGSPLAAADLAEVDATFSHSLDGVWCARATAAVISALLADATRDEAIAAALAELPAGSWSDAVVRECLDVASRASDHVALAGALEREVIDHTYSYACAAPETLGLVLAHLQRARDADALLLAAAAHPRHADGLLPLAGAIAGAAFPPTGEADQPSWLSLGGGVAALEGVAVGPLAGTSIDAIVDLIVESASG